MKTKLFSNHFKRPGWIFLILSSILLSIFYLEKIDFESFDFGRANFKWFVLWGMAISYVILLNLFALPLFFVLRFNYTLNRLKSFKP
jgi:hypothetical protein